MIGRKKPESVTNDRLVKIKPTLFWHPTRLIIKMIKQLDENSEEMKGSLKNKGLYLKIKGCTVEFTLETAFKQIIDSENVMNDSDVKETKISNLRIWYVFIFYHT